MHKLAYDPPNKTQDWINRLCSDMVSRTLKIVMVESKTAKVNPGPLYIFHFMTDLTESHQSTSTQLPPGSKDLVKESEGLPWDSGRSLLDRATFRKWSEYGTPTKGQAAEGKKTQTLGRKRNPKETEIAPGGQSQKESHYSPLDPIPPNGKMAEGEKPKP